MDIYINLDHASYKALEEAMRAFKETVHTSVEGFYHKSIRLPVGDATFEFTGPAVKAPPVENDLLDRRKGERRLLCDPYSTYYRRHGKERRKSFWHKRTGPIDRRINDDLEDRHYRRKGPFKFDRRKKADV